ncbi:MAG: DUF2000 domain-containing protein, partial [Eubacterium sp.]|nr:DUF2000 domain-containing protein [Eubacterium sp.]
YGDHREIHLLRRRQRQMCIRDCIDKMAECPENALSYIGIAICGNKKKINRLTGNLPLLR